jgi:hypothetical protein
MVKRRSPYEKYIEKIDIQNMDEIIVNGVKHYIPKLSKEEQDKINILLYGRQQNA